MKSVIIKPQHEQLKNYVQYFLFFQKTESTFLNYTTFPNNNLCLAIYKENRIDYTNQSGINQCTIKEGRRRFTSKLYGFHKMPFNVDIHSPLDQICIIFYPSALRVFTGESYDDLLQSDQVADFFSSVDTSVLEQLFEEQDFSKRAGQLEQVLVSHLNYELSHKLKEALYTISVSNDQYLTVETLAKQLKISTPSLFRLFKHQLGQNPKSYLKTIRFRTVLNEVLNKQSTLTDIAHVNQFYDQAHFINDFKTFSGYSPNQLINKISVQQTDLTWIYNKK